MTRPHDAMAPVYDLVYQEDFGEFYHWLTDTTLDVVCELVPVGARIVDFGAATGRMALPLAQAGYRITAVEPSGPMIDRLREAASGADIECVPLCRAFSYVCAAVFIFLHYKIAISLCMCRRFYNLPLM